MFKAVINFIRKRNFLKITQYVSDDSAVIFGSSIEVFSAKTSNIELQGKLLLGVPLTGTLPGFSHKYTTIVSLGKNSKLIIHGDVHIAPGCTIRVGENGVLELGGKNVIAHDTTIIATKKISIGKNSSISWNCNLIDDDAHSFFRTDGKKIKRIRKPLVIGDNVGIQMNVVIPSGGTIGDNSIISANTVIRTDVPQDTLIYSVNENKSLPNFTTGFQFQ
jgi:acetyltransferase-like isoleucine patch superfamily enzyme